MLLYVVWDLDYEKLEWILEGLEDLDLGKDENGTSKTLEAVIIDEGLFLSRIGDRTTDAVRCIEILVGRGAKWNPDAKDLLAPRRRIAKKSTRHVFQLVSCLLETEAATKQTLWDLVRTPTMRMKLEKESPYHWRCIAKLL